MTGRGEPVETIRLQRPDLLLHFFSGQETAAEWALGGENGPPHSGVMIATNAEKLVRLYRNPKLFQDCISPVYFPDGVGAVLLGGGKYSRIPGVELWLHVLKGADRRGFKVSVYGGTPDVSRRTDDILRETYQALDLSVLNGFLKDDAYLQDLNERCPDVVFVALGSPRQELFIARLQQTNPEALYMGLGGALDILTKRKKRAPRLFQALRAEFAYRLLSEPVRIFRQTALIKFTWLLWSGKFGAQHWDNDPVDAKQGKILVNCEKKQEH